MEEDFELVNESNFTLIDSDMNSSSVALTKTTISKIEPTEFENEYELELPSGARIGHRSLFKYYKQSFGHRNLELKKSNNLTVRDKYLAIAGNGAYTGMYKMNKIMNKKINYLL